jgi:hypothetical protein
MVAAKPDCTGRKFGRLTVLGKGDRSASGVQRWRCLCDCGNVVQRIRSTLERSKISSCGCEKKERTRKMGLDKAKSDILGQRFGWLTVIGKGESIKDRQGRTRQLWNVECKCGKILSLPRGNFDRKDGRNAQKSCGCFKSSGLVRKYGHSKKFIGQKYGNLTVLEVTNRRSEKLKKPLYKCLCDCGKTCEITVQKLKSGYRLNCGDLSHQPGLRYPPAPDPYPEQAGELVAKYLYLTQPKAQKFNARVQDEKVNRLLRAAWILTYREWQGENFSEKHKFRFICKHLRYAEGQVKIKEWVESGKKSRYTFTRYKRNEIGGMMTDSTSFNEAASTEGKTQPEPMLSTPKRRHIKFQRC